jgi:Holliday junction DNA helicase RuvA
MISFLKGIVQSQKNDVVVLQMGGFGMQISVPVSVIAATSSELELHTYMHWNQENGPALFGFIETAQRDLFCLLISVSGIGPRMALALLSAFPVSTLINALVSGDVSLLSSVSGIGRKKAETLILNLKEKAEKFIVPLSVAGNATGFAIHIKDLSEALLSLGYSRQEIVLAVDQLRGVEGASNFAFDQLLRKSLQFLSKGR